MKFNTARKAIKVGNSIFVSIPAMWLKINSIKIGDPLKVEGGAKVLRITKIRKEEEIREEK